MPESRGEESKKEGQFKEEKTPSWDFYEMERGKRGDRVGVGAWGKGKYLSKNKTNFLGSRARYQEGNLGREGGE